MIVAGSQEFDGITGAFAKVLADVENVTRSQTADTGTYRYTYADLSDVLDAVKRACNAHGLGVSQTVSTDAENGLVLVHTTIVHASGQYLTFAPLGLPLGRDPQSTGSAITYARRYALMSVFGIASEDDDGSQATREAQARQQRPRGRTPEETHIHELFAAHDAEAGRIVRQQFREHFGCGLSSLPAVRHAEALAWVDDALAEVLSDRDRADDNDSDEAQDDDQ
jgi:hypothetical protein